jgi:hypothetical protein
MKKAKGRARAGGRGAASAGAPAVDPDEILPEYDFSGGERGRYAARYAEGTNVVVLDPDVAAVFPTGAAVNDALRALAGIIQQHRPTKPRRRRPSRRTA